MAGCEAGEGWYLPTGLISRLSLGISRPDLALLGPVFPPRLKQGLQRPEEGACESRSPRGSSGQGLDRGEGPGGTGRWGLGYTHFWF